MTWCGWRGYEREEKEGEREVDNLSTCGCVIQLYLWENTRFIEIVQAPSGDRDVE